MTYDLTRLPSGNRGWQELIDYVSKSDDRAERYFLELKSDIDLSTDEGRAKVAKFVLGAANRDPVQAGKWFEGRALMVLGVSKGSVTGIGTFEAKDLAQFVTRFVGTPGPSWDHHSIPAVGEDQVVVIIVDPPDPAKQPWPSLSEGYGLLNGIIYIRADGATRPAKGREVAEMVERTRKAQSPTTELAVDVVGSACAYRCDEDILEEYISRTSDRLIAAFPASKAPISPTSPTYSITSFLESSGLGGKGLFDPTGMQKPDPRSREQYTAEIEAWQTQCRKAWPKMLKKLASVVVPAITIKVSNLSETYLENVRCSLHISGPVTATKKRTSRNFSPLRQLPDPPRQWGPISHDFFSPMINAPQMFNVQPGVDPGTYDVLNHKNTNSVEFDFVVGELPPEEAFETPEDERILILNANPADVPAVKGTWKITAKGHHQSYKGELVVEVESRGIRDFSAGVRRSLLPG